ncbi:MAG: hypothetical protein ACUVUR_06655, partial [bacterium]
YLFIDFQAPPSVPEQLRRDLLHREEILRLAFFRLPEMKTTEKQTQTTVASAQPDSESLT